LTGDYDITISTLGGAAPADGFIDSQNTYAYMKANGTPPSSLPNAKAKSRAYARYKHIVFSLSQFCSLGGVIAVTPTGGDVNTAPSAIKLTVRMREPAGLVTQDELNAGQTLTGLPAIKRVVARCCIAAQGNYTMEIYDPSTVNERATDGAATTARPKQSSIIMDTVGALAANIAAAEAAITVVAL
jgi:hypothetical protein